MSPNPKTIHENILAAEAQELMKQNNITSLFVVDQQNQYIGVIHLHNIIKEGIY
jgi:arabinose-5-phosphate isomerase